MGQREKWWDKSEARKMGREKWGEKKVGREARKVRRVKSGGQKSVAK